MPQNSGVLTTGRIDHPIGKVFQRVFLETLRSELMYGLFGTLSTMGQHQGATQIWRRQIKFAAATTPLDEVHEPSPLLPSKTDIEVSLAQYGAWLKDSVWRQFTGLNQDATAYTIELAEQAALTIDTLIREVCAGTASYTTATNGDPTETLLNNTDIDTITKNLATYDVKPVSDRIAASTGQGTSPIAKSYIGIAHTALMNDFKAVPGSKLLHTYASTVNAYPGEYCNTGMVRWILTTNAKVVSGTYYCLIMGNGFFGKVKLTGGDPPMIHHPAKTHGGPLEMYSTSGWKRTFAAKILNSLCGHVLRVTSAY